MNVWSLGSGSRGNALVLERDGQALLVDCGFGPRALASRLALIGIEPTQIIGLVLTHEHVDHASGAERAQHKWRWPVYASAGTLAALPDVTARWRRPLAAGERIDADGFAIEAGAIPHDAAEPLAYAITHERSGHRVGIAHDLGAVPAALPALFARCDVLCIEANHDAEMLRTGPYAASLKARIRGGRGHLDNHRTAALLAELAHPQLRAIALLHLSETNNTPELATQTVRSILRRAQVHTPVMAATGRAPSSLATANDRERTVAQLSLPI
ncbi:MAG: MBL fold metallo-hydrolase [Gemmatimonadaceae bacterium]|nr:MBL fold metallo-hydrolase [Gemmatimonadaceae bacterium]